MATFSKNVLETFDMFDQGTTQCTLEKWREYMDPSDRPRLIGIAGEMLIAPGQSYNVNYRMRNRYGQRVWVNSRGRTYADENGAPAYVLGRISAQFDSYRADMVPQGFHRKGLKAELKRVWMGNADGYILMAGVDDLRVLNMKNGWEFGDAVIQSLARGLTLLAGVKHVYRINSDRFAVVMVGVDEAASGKRLPGFRNSCADSARYRAEACR